MLSQDQQSVALDGDAVRSIREHKRLTQLYVAKVVGVTTDTVSRWENNRYPTIRRDNAVKLADALEVELLEILKRGEPEGTVVPVPKKRSLFPWLVTISVVLIAGGVFLSFILGKNNSFDPPLLQVEGLIPAHAAPGSRFPARVDIVSEAPLTGVIYRVILPPGLRFVSAQPAPSSVDPDRGIIRWILRQPTTAIRIDYRIAVSAELPLETVVTLHSEVVPHADGVQPPRPLEFREQIRIAPVHWADSNANMIIDDLEILVFSEVIGDLDTFDREWQEVETLWHAGGYEWDQKRLMFRPLESSSQ